MIFLGYQAWIPHFTSIINWAVKVGIHSMCHIRKYAGWSAIIDTSIQISGKKLLVILRVPLIKQYEKALTLRDAECIGIYILQRCDGEIVKSCLLDTFTKSGLPTTMIKDQGSDLKLGLRKTNDLIKKHPSVKIIEDIQDITHATANALKAEYLERADYLAFIASVNDINSKLAYSENSSLRSPKIRNKGRFQSISRIAKWAHSILSILNRERKNMTKEAVKIIETTLPSFDYMRNTDGERLKDYASIKLEEKLPDLSIHAEFITEFLQVTNITNQIQRLLKVRGFNLETYKIACNLCRNLPEKSKVRIRLTAWLLEHKIIYDRINTANISIDVCSDILECLFGKYKYLLQRFGKQDFNRLVSTLPLLCGEQNPSLILAALNDVSQKEVLNWQKINVPETSQQKRRKVLGSPSDVKKLGMACIA